jgi:hypothetical protein
VAAFREANREAARDTERERAAGPAYRTVFAFVGDPNDLLISGGVRNGQEMTNAPALVDAPLGDGHVVLFSFNPFWRSETLGSYALVFNALLHHGHLGAGHN